MDCKCLHCDLPTSGSQIHRSCLRDWLSCDENLEAISSEEENPVLCDKETTANEYLDAKNGEDSIFDAIYQFETVKTSIDVSLNTLTQAYPNENFDSVSYQNIMLHKYLTSEVTMKEFLLMHNQWGVDNLAHYPRNNPIRMRKGVHIDVNNKIYHMMCCDKDYTKGIITIESTKCSKGIQLIVDHCTTFFCGKCEKFLFDTIEFMSPKTYAIPREDVFPKCNNMIISGVNNRDENTYFDVYSHEILAILQIDAE